MRNKVVTLTNKTKQEVYLHCTRVYEVMDRKVVLELDREKQTDDLWWHMKMADCFNADYEYHKEDKLVILAVDEEMITAMRGY